MTLTKTVQSFAHDAANVASDLGSQIGNQASGLGNRAADLGAEAASSMAAAASNLAHTIGQKVPSVQVKQKKSSPWKLLLLIVAGIGGAVLFLGKRRKSTVVDATSSYGTPMPRAGESADESKASVKEAAAEATDIAKDAASEAKDTAKDAGQGAAKEVKKEVKETVKANASKVTDEADDVSGSSGKQEPGAAKQ